MPTYDYECLICSNRFESNHPINAGRPPCPVCTGEVRQVFLQAPAMHGDAARGRELAVRSLDPGAASSPSHGAGCACCKSK